MPSYFFIFLAFNAPGSWVFAAHPSSVHLHAAGRTWALLNVEVPAIPIKIKKLIVRSDCQLDRRNWIGFNGVLQARLTSLSAAFSSILGYLYLLGSIYLLLPVWNLEFSHCRIVQGVSCACCPLPEGLSVLFLWAENALPWVCFQSSLQEFGCLKPPCSCIPLSSGCAVFHKVWFVHVLALWPAVRGSCMAV